MTEGSERRRHERFDLIAQVFVRSGKVDTLLDVTNISRSGARLDMGTLRRPNWLALSREVEFRLLDPEGGPLIEITGKVVRIAEDMDQRYFAIEFDELLDREVVRRACVDVGRPPPLPSRQHPSS